MGFFLQLQQFVLEPLRDWVFPLAVGFLVFCGGFCLRGISFRALKGWLEKIKWTWGDLLIETARGPFILWCLMLAIYVAMAISPVTQATVRLAGAFLKILWILSLTLVVARLADQLIRRYGAKFSGTLPLTSLTQNLTKGIILLTGALIILNSFGISITPILTALGVGGLAVALALQETLANLFSGFYIAIARQVRIGDYIKLDSGEEGFIIDIGWRSTRIRHLSNNLIVIPNTKLAQAIVTNFNLPTSQLAVLVEMDVDARSDLAKVERVTVQAAKEVMREVSGGVPEFEPFIRFHTFGDSGIHFSVILQGKTFVDQYLIKHEFIKRVHRRYQQEGISYPIQSVLLESPKSDPGHSA